MTRQRWHRARSETSSAGTGRAQPFDFELEELGPQQPSHRPRRRRRHEGDEGRTERRAAGPMIDPRIAARRAQVEADEADKAAAGTRRRRRLAGAAVALLTLAGASALVLLSPLASVRAIEVRGADRTGATAVRAASGLSARPPLLRIDEDRVAGSVAALPWVRSARLERRWPRTVVLTIEERQPAAVAPCLTDRTSSCLVDAEGRVLATAADDPRVASTLPRLVEVPAAGEPGATLPDAARGPLAVAVALPDALRPLVRSVRGEGGEVLLDLQAPGRDATPPVVRLGRPDRISDKLTAAATVLARTSVNGIELLDVRVPESPALTRVAPLTLPPATRVR